jgi:hypothetical protein
MKFKPGDYVSSEPQEFMWKVLETNSDSYKLECVKWDRKGPRKNSWKVGDIQWFPYEDDVDRLKNQNIWIVKQILECYSK